MATTSTKLYKFLATDVAPYKGPLPNMWVKFLSKHGYTKSPIEKGIFQYLGSLGYTGKFSKRWGKWYNATFV